MTPDQLLERYGTKADIARAGEERRKAIPEMKNDGEITRQMVQGWFERGNVPLDKQTLFEVDTGGELRADVSAEFRSVVQGAAA